MNGEKKGESFRPEIGAGRLDWEEFAYVTKLRPFGVPLSGAMNWGSILGAKKW